MPIAMLSCFKNRLKPKKAAKQDKGIPPIDHEGIQEAQPSLPPQSSTSESIRGNNPEDSVSIISKRSRNLWQAAFAKLDDVQQDSLSIFEKAQGFSVVQSVADETEKRYRESQEAGWKISGGKDKSGINLRTAAEKILSSVLWSKKLIDAGVAFDPTGYSASAWTIISLGLQIVQNNVHRLQALFEASGTLTDTLTRCAAIEASYRDKSLRDSDHLEDTLVDVYVAILEFSAEIIKQNRMNVVRKVLTSISSLAEQPLQEFNAKLNSKEKDLRKWTKVIEHQYRKLEMQEAGEKINAALNGIEGVNQRLSGIESRILSAEDHDILKWLSEYDFSASHNSALSQRESGTGAWILDNLQYGEWKSSDCNLLWLHGKSGSGKTVLCSKIIEDLQYLCTEDPSYALAYWYFTFSSQSSLNIDNLLSSIIRQICARTRTLNDNIRGLWKINCAAGGRPTTATLMEVLDSLIVGLKTANQNALIVLDALDEYPLSRGQTFPDVQQTSERKDVLLWLREFCAKHENAHVAVLSRDENDIRDFLDEALKVDVAKSVVDDLGLFIPNSIRRIVEQDPWKAEYEPAMSSRIEGVSEKRFRWASLVLRRFSECLTREAMVQCLKTLPDSLEAMYTDVLMRQIPKNYRKEARLMLMWLTYSLRPLRLRELASVASLPEPKDVLRICTSSLIILSQEAVQPYGQSVDAAWLTFTQLDWEEVTIVKFDHFSVKEYMMSEGLSASSANPASSFYVPPPLAHLSMAELSVSYLLGTNGSHFTEADVYVERTLEIPSDDEAPEVHEEVHRIHKGRLGVPLWPEFPLLEYSTFWHRHVREVDAIVAKLGSADATQPKASDLKAETQSTLRQSEKLRSQIHRLFCDAFSQSFRNWVYLLGRFTREIPSEPSEALSPIWLASRLNLPDTVQRLLQYETKVGRSIDFVYQSDPQSDPLADPQRDFERPPIQIAAKYGHLKVLSLLLETDMLVEQSDLAPMVKDFTQHGGAVLGTILEARPHLTITEHIVESAVRASERDDVYMYILGLPGHANPSKAVFEYIVKKIGWYSDGNVVDVGLVKTILRRGDDIGYNRGEIMEASIQGEGSGRITELVSDRSKAPSISHSILALMVANESCGADMLAVVLEHYKDVKISQDLLTLMFANSECGAKMLALVLRHRKGIRISQDLLVAAASARDGTNFRLLLDYDENIEVSENAVTAAAGNPYGGPAIFWTISSHNKKVKVSEATLEAAARNWSEGPYLISVVSSLDEKIEVTEDTLKAAAKTSSANFSAILGLNKKIEISEDVLKVAARSFPDGVRIFSIVLDYDKNIEVSEDTLIALLTKYPWDREGTLWAVLNRSKKVEVGEELLKFAARNKDSAVKMFWTLVGLKKNIVISVGVMDAIAEDERVGRDILDVLMDHSNCENGVPSGFESLEEMKGGLGLSGRNRHFDECQLRVSWEMMRAIVRWEPDGIDFLMAHKRPNVTFARETTQPVPSDPNPST